MELVKFLGYENIYAKFQIKMGKLPNGNNLTQLLIAHEGKWITEDSMFCHSQYQFYEDVQKDLGKNLTFIAKECSEILNRSLFLYELDYNRQNDYILAVPATGEEIYFEIYGVDQYGALSLLVEREL